MYMPMRFSGVVMTALFPMIVTSLSSRPAPLRAFVPAEASGFSCERKGGSETLKGLSFRPCPWMTCRKVFAALAPHGVPDEAGRLEGTAGAGIPGGRRRETELQPRYAHEPKPGVKGVNFETIPEKEKGQDLHPDLVFWSRGRDLNHVTSGL